MSFSIALKFIYSFVREGGGDQCCYLPKMHSYMPEQIKSKLCESCHSPVCSPTHPYRASDGEKLFIYFKHTQTRIVPPCILFMWMETTQLLVDGAVRQRERGGGGEASIGQTCLCGAIFMGPCWSSGFHVLLSLLQQGPGSEHGHWLRRKNKANTTKEIC